MSIVCRSLGLFAVLALLFFSDLLLHPSRVLYSDHSDLLTETLPAKSFLVRSWQRTGEVPLWCPYSYGGMPYVHDIKVAPFYPLHLPLYLIPEKSLGAALSWLVVFHVFAAGASMYFYARNQGLEGTAAVVAGLGYMFAGKWLLHVLAGGHYVLIPLAWLPLVLLALDTAIRRGSLVWATWAGAAFGLIVLGGHPQGTMYAGVFVALWSVGPALETAGYLSGAGPRSRRRTLIAFAQWLGFGVWTVLLAAALAAIELLPALEAMSQATRGAGVSSGWNIWLTLVFLLDLIGAPLTGPHWEAAGGVGVLWLAAAVLGLVLGGKRVIFQAGVALFLVAFALGLGDALQQVPGLHLFQIHSRMLLLLAVPLSLLTGTTTQVLLQRSLSAAQVRRCRLVLSGVVLFALMLAGFRYFLAAKHELRTPIYWYALVALVPTAFWLLGRFRSAVASTAHPSWPGLLWVVVLLADLWALARPLVQVRPLGPVYEPSESVRFLADHREERGRVLDRGAGDRRRKPVLTEPSASPLDPALPLLLEIESLRGYNSVDVRRYKEYLKFVTDDGRPVRPREGRFGFPILDNFPIENRQLLDLLNVRYLLEPSDPSRRPFDEIERDPTWVKVGEDVKPHAYLVIVGGVNELPPFTLYENRKVFPRAFIVPEAAPLPERSAVLDALKATDLRRRVLLEDYTPGSESAEPQGAFRPAKILDYQPNRVIIDVEAGPPGFLVLGDVWFPGWICSVDGYPTPVYRADYLFRAVELSAGAHEVVFVFKPVSYRWGKLVTLAALVLLALVTCSTRLPRWLRLCARIT